MESSSSRMTCYMLSGMLNVSHLLLLCSQTAIVPYLHFAQGVADAKCILAMADRPSSCLCVCLSVPHRIPTLLHRPGCDLGEW